MALKNQLNFSGGPGVLPECVLQQAREAVSEVPEVGLSVLGISHRSDWFAAIVTELETHVRRLLELPDDYHILFLQGGATQQFSMLPMTLLRGSRHSADYLHTGYWSGKAIPEARKQGSVRVLWSGKSREFRRLPEDEELPFSPTAPYFHYASNETVEGLQFHRVPGLEQVPRACDMSSDFLSRPIEAHRFALIYAHAQKNLGPAGVTVVVLRNDLLQQSAPDLPDFLNYRLQVEAHSILNTPPVFSIYVVLLVARWLVHEVGGLQHMAQINKDKADCLYRMIDHSDGFYQGRAARRDRSQMNVTFTLPTLELEKLFLSESGSAGFSGLEGHRSMGGLRASIYNALTLGAVEELVDFMESFQRKHSIQWIHDSRKVA